MEKTYLLKMGNITRELPIVPVSKDTSIASYVMLGDTEMVQVCAQLLYDKLPKFDIDILVCPEAKSIPLAQSLAQLLKVNYVVIRKSVKAYMKNPVIEKVKSITTDAEQNLVIDEADVARIKGRNICVLDDVVSTGGSLKAIRQILDKTGCKIVCEACVLLEKAGYSDNKLIYLADLPLFDQYGAQKGE